MRSWLASRKFLISNSTPWTDLVDFQCSPMALLRNMPPLQARQCILLACGFLADLPESLYDILARHPYDETLEIDA